MIEKKVVFTAEGGNVSSFMDKLKKDSEDLGRGLIRDARKYTTSGKEALTYIEDQIRAIERRGKADRESRKIELDLARSKGTITPQDYKSKMTGISSGAKIDDQQVRLLKELIEAVKVSSRREIIEDRANVEKQVRSDKSLDEFGVKGDELESFKRTLQRQQIGGIKTQEETEKGQFVSGKGAARSIAGGAAGSPNIIHAGLIAASVGVGLFSSVAGQIMGQVGQRALQQARKFQDAQGGMSSLTGRSGGNYSGSMTSLGMANADFLPIWRQTAIARGGVDGESKQRARDIAYLSKGTGFGQDMFLQMETLTRGGGMSARAGTQRFVRGLQGIGAIEGQDMSLLGEYLPILVNLQQEQVKLTGETNNEIATKLVTGIASLDESFRNPNVLKNLLPSILAGARTPSTPQVEALQFRALSKLNPGMNLMELEAQRENPTLNYIEDLFTSLRSVSPNQEMFARNIRGTFGLTSTMAIKAARGFGQEGFNLGDFANEAGITNLNRRAGAGYGTGVLTAKTAEWNAKFETLGNNLIGVLQALVLGSSGLGKIIKSANKVNKTIVEQNEATAKEMEKGGGFWAKFIANIFRNVSDPTNPHRGKNITK